MENIDALSIVGVVATIISLAVGCVALGLALANRPCAICKPQQVFNDGDEEL